MILQVVQTSYNLEKKILKIRQIEWRLIKS